MGSQQISKTALSLVSKKIIARCNVQMILVRAMSRFLLDIFAVKRQASPATTGSLSLIESFSVDIFAYQSAIEKVFSVFLIRIYYT